MGPPLSHRWLISATITALLTTDAVSRSNARGQEPRSFPSQLTTLRDSTAAVGANEPIPSPGNKSQADAITKGLQYFRSQEWTLAIEQFSVAIRQFPEDPSGYWFRAQSRERLGNIAGARIDYGDVVRIVDAPTEVPALRAKGYALIVLGRYDDALSHLNAALSLEPNDEESLMLLGRTCELTKDLESAVKHYTQLIHVSPKSADALLCRGNVYVRLGRAGDAIADQKRAMRLGNITRGEFLYQDTENGTLYRFVFVPPGRRWIGYEEQQRIAVAGQARQLLFGHNATPLQEVELRQGFFLLDREVTVSQFDAIREKAPTESTPSQKGKANLRLRVEAVEGSSLGEVSEIENNPHLPKTDVSWIDAMKFCIAMQERIGLAVRLPTEVEWECAARHDRTWLYPWGRGIGEEFPAPSGQVKDGPRPLGSSENGDVTPLGVYDMAGNVSEWCLDEYQNTLFEDSSLRRNYTPAMCSFFKQFRNPPSRSAYSRLSDDVLRELESSRRSFRGGSYKDNAFNCQVPVRRAMLASEASSVIGFRPVLLMRVAK